MEGSVLDSLLLQKARAGDAQAFDELVSRHGRLVLSLARKITGHRQEAEDVAQEAFLRFYRSLGKIDPERPLEPWLVRLTVNAARSRVSRRPERREEALSESREFENPATLDPGRTLEQAQLREALNLALAILPEREQMVFLLRDQEGLDVAVISEALGVAEVTVRRQSTEARRKIADWFRKNRPELLPR